MYPGLPQACCVAEDLEHLSLLSPLPKLWNYRYVPQCPNLVGSVDRTQGFLCGRQVFHQLIFIPSLLHGMEL